MRRLVRVLALGLTIGLPATPALAQSARLGVDEIVYALLSITPEQARELTTLLRSPGAIAHDLVEATDAVTHLAPALPAALLHDVVTAPVRDAHVILGVVTDTVELVRRPAGEPRGLFRHTLRALHRSQVFTAAASVVRRVTHPSNRTARLAIVLTARGHGVPVRAEHLDMLDRAIRRDDPDLGPLLQGVVETLARMYGRDAVRLILD
ncbi:MAG TPA: hypothetical protein VHO73_02450 [Methylomirabilota bacterium]|jgi:hypothetical protein|nr:hypothetical protein [Methylomirabilota bacterium]